MTREEAEAKAREIVDVVQCGQGKLPPQTAVDFRYRITAALLEAAQPKEPTLDDVRQMTAEELAAPCVPPQSPVHKVRIRADFNISDKDVLINAEIEKRWPSEEECEQVFNNGVTLLSYWEIHDWLRSRLLGKGE